MVLWNLRRGFCNWIIFAATGRLNCQWNSLLRSCAILSAFDRMKHSKVPQKAHQRYRVLWSLVVLKTAWRLKRRVPWAHQKWVRNQCSKCHLHFVMFHRSRKQTVTSQESNAVRYSLCPFWVASFIIKSKIKQTVFDTYEWHHFNTMFWGNLSDFVGLLLNRVGNTHSQSI